MHHLHALPALVGHHTLLAYVSVFLVSLGESLALVGLVVPGTVIMFGFGALVAAGSLGLAPVLLLAAAGAVAGDGISYWLGRHYRDGLRRVWPFRRYPEMLKRGELFFRRHGGKSILFGRFVGPVRPVIPVVAGMLGMSPISFGVVNVLSAMGWAVAYLLPGVLFGTSLALAGTVSSRLAVLALILLVALWGSIWLVRRLVSLISRRGPIWLASLKRRLSVDARVDGDLPPFKRFLAALLQRPHGEELFFITLVLVFIAAGWGFLGVLQDVLARDPLVLADRSVYHFLQPLRTAWADTFFIVITEFGDSIVNISLAAAVALVLIGKRCFRAAGFWTLAVAGGELGVHLLKWSIHQPRPMALYHGVSSYGFPSGHTTMSVIVYGFLAIMLIRGLSGSRHWGGVVGALMIAFIIALSRLYLGAHWLSDVLGGFFIGTGWTALLGIAYLKQPDEGVPKRWLALVALIVVLVVGTMHVARRFEKDVAFYAPQRNNRSMSAAAWLDGGWRELPAWRIDMVGEREQPLTLQWAGSPGELARILSAAGWQDAPLLTVKALLGMLSPDTPLQALPVLPRLHSGRVDELRLIRMDRDHRWVLRLWPSDFTIDPGNIPISVGSIEIQRRRHLTWLITAAGDTGEHDRQQDALIQMLDSRATVESVRRMDDGSQTAHRRRLHWLGRVLLGRSRD
jgi:membrane protein DedA with SNARE-associated domain/membrane-associated phospholipid phosphatase